MKVTVLWEDQRAAKPKGFGPHDLLAACVADRLSCKKNDVDQCVVSAPKKGVSKVFTALQKDLSKLSKYGPVFAVIDRDKVREHWKDHLPPADCMSAIHQRIANEVSGDYQVVFLVKNVESLVNACCEQIGLPAPHKKPTLDERDRLLHKAAWGERRIRDSILDACPSFKRLVEKVCGSMGANATPG